VLGAAQGAIDGVIELAGRSPNTQSFGQRQAKLGHQQFDRIGIAHADALIRTAREWAWRLTERSYDNALAGVSDDEELEIQLAQAETYACRAAKQAASTIFDLAGADAIVRGSKIERSFRDANTGGQHTLTIPTSYERMGQYYVTRANPGASAPDRGDAAARDA
jgi:alkylation response protein AidB-like acyl-CoA dehydrogenase